MITKYGKVVVPIQLIDIADSIKLENYKTNTPAKFQKHTDVSSVGKIFTQDLGSLVSEDPSKIDWVFFSVCQGAEPHTDQLDPNVFEDITYIIPIILPTKISTITAQQDKAEVSLFEVYKFDHTKTHSMELQDTESGCVVIMAGILK
jgi:hypothetical protein